MPLSLYICHRIINLIILNVLVWSETWNGREDAICPSIEEATQPLLLTAWRFSIQSYYISHYRSLFISFSPDSALSGTNLPRKIYFTNLQHHCLISGLLNLNDYFSEPLRIFNIAWYYYYFGAAVFCLLQTPLFYIPLPLQPSDFQHCPSTFFLLS